MNMKALLVAISIALLLVACGPQETTPQEPATQPTAPDTVRKEEPVVVEEHVERAPEAPAAEKTDEDVANIEITTTEVDELEAEFDTSDLDTLEEDLAAIDDLDLG